MTAANHLKVYCVELPSPRTWYDMSEKYYLFVMCHRMLYID